MFNNLKHVYVNKCLSHIISVFITKLFVENWYNTIDCWNYYILDDLLCSTIGHDFVMVSLQNNHQVHVCLTFISHWFLLFSLEKKNIDSSM
jgi:hypothetical protein